jgi:prophage DNA circulation protein
MTITLSRMSFGGIAFPTTEVSIQGGQRSHIHEYPHTDGGDLEKMGRKLYMIRVSAWFHELTGIAAQNYPDLWPSGLRQLRALLESGETKDLVVPTIGTIRAFPTSWTQKFVAASALDGEKVDLEFCEDQEGAFGDVEAEFAAASVSTALDQLNEAAALMEFRGIARIPNIFEQINDAVGSFVALKDQAQAQSTLISDKIESIKSLCQQVESVVDFAGTAPTVGVETAVRNLWNAANDVAQNLVAPATKTLVFLVPSKMTVQEVSQRLYGKTDRVADLLKLNAFPNAFAIPAGTQVLYAVPA